MENVYWETFYDEPDETIDNASQFAVYVAKHIQNSSDILDLGCGNCRDSIFFTKEGHSVTAVDTALKKNTREGSLRRVKEDVLQYIQRTSASYDVIYMRWFLHALPVRQQYSVIRHAAACLRYGGTLWIENRSINDSVLLSHSSYNKDDGSYTTSHKRWPTGEEQLYDMFDKSDVSIICIEESRGFSKAGVRSYNSDPLLYRIKAAYANARVDAVRTKPANTQDANWGDAFSVSVDTEGVHVTREDVQKGWGQALVLPGHLRIGNIVYDTNIRVGNSAENTKLVPVAPIIAHQLKMACKVRGMMALLNRVVDILDEHSVPWHLDCGTLLGFVRQGRLLEHDTDVDVSTHASFYKRTSSIPWNTYGLSVTRSISNQKGGIVSVRFHDERMYCDIYANPGFPKLERVTFQDRPYYIPVHSDVYLTQLYGNWKTPSGKHANWPKLWHDGLLTGDYQPFYETVRASIPPKN
jgi:SAM-dependent methyltransferase